MCGIVGFNFEDKDLLKEMMNLISYRGPDQKGIFFDKGVSLGHLRLSIVDLSTKGKQPMPNMNNDCQITFNGEIYNYKEIRKNLEKAGYSFNSNSDTEVIVNAYSKYGASCLEKLNGDFAFCIYDSKKKLFFLARDRLGIKPIYYYFDGKTFAFASEYKALLPLVKKRSVNQLALSRYVSLRYNYGRETLINGISRVLPGEQIIFNLKTKTLKKTRFYDTTFPTKFTNESFVSLKEQTRNLLEDSVKIRMMSDVPLGAYLSGGIDSASIVSLMSKISGNRAKNIKTFSVGFGYGKDTDETEYSRKISKQFNTDHKEFIVDSKIARELPKIVWHCDEPLADPALLPIYFLSKKTKPHATVVLTGDGGDEVFAGYEQNKFLKLGSLPWLARRAAIPALHAIPAKSLKSVFKYAPKLGPEGKKRAIAFLKEDKPLKQYLQITSIFNDAEKKELCPQLKPFDKELSVFFKNKQPLINQVLKMEFETQLPENMLHKADRMTMAHSVEARVPFLDHRLVEFGAKLPPKYKLNGFTEKYILREAMKDMLPKQILARKKQRFYVPIDKWINNDLKDMSDELLSASAIAKTEVFDARKVLNIREKYKTAPLFYARQLWVILTYQLWHKQFIQQGYQDK